MMRNRLLRMVGLVCLASMIVILSGCGGPKGSIEGYVYIPQFASMTRLTGGREIPIGNKPVPDATVTCSGYRGSVRTDSSGHFRMDKVEIGTQTVVMTRPGFGTATATVEVLEGQLAAIRADEGLLKKKWTMLVYMDADNDLGYPDSGGQINDLALLDINEMEKVGSTNDVNILVQWDRSGNHTDWTTTRRYYIKKESHTSYDIDSLELADLGEQDMSDPQTLQSFLVWGMTNYPADHYVVVLWNHGAGIWPRAQQKRLWSRTRGICLDETTGFDAFDCLTTDELKGAFTGAETATGHRIEVLDFDACLMNMAEVAYGLNGLFDYIVGSEEVTPGTGNPYTDILEDLTQNPDQTPAQYATMKAEMFANAYPNYPNYGGRGVTSSVLDLTGNRMTDLASALSGFAQEVKNSSAKEAVIMASIDPNVERYAYYENVDIGLWMERIISAAGIDSAVRAAATNVKTALGNMVIALHNTGTYRGQGLAVLLPPSRNQWQFYQSSNRYPATDFAVNNSSWLTMIQNLLPKQSTLSALSVKVTWDEALDCDLEVCEPDGLWYSAYANDPYVGSAFSTVNGNYSANNSGGPGAQESFTLKATYEIGNSGYKFRVANYSDSTAHVTMTVTTNGVDQVYSYTLNAWSASTPVVPAVQ